jgi:formate/nitrite transporter FocA (FNT family)
MPMSIIPGANVTRGRFIDWNLIPVTSGNIAGRFVFIGEVCCISFKKGLSFISPT